MKFAKRVFVFYNLMFTSLYLLTESPKILSYGSKKNPKKQKPLTSFKGFFF